MTTLLRLICKNNTCYRFLNSDGLILTLGGVRTHAEQQCPPKPCPPKPCPPKPCDNAAKAKPVKCVPKVQNNVKTFKVYRYDGLASRGVPRMATYNFDVSKCGKMLLDALHLMKEMDPSLTFRRSCREGICGSCAMNVQGSNVLVCIKGIPPGRIISIYPLPHMYVIRDLVVDMEWFYETYRSIRPYLIRHQEIEMGKNQLAQSIKDNNKMVGLYECVLCSCCSTACPSYWWNGRRFLGPAALLHAYRWVIDSRDDDHHQRLFELRDDFKAYRCHSIFQCSVTCPKGLHPGTYIQYLKLLIAEVHKKPQPEMDPMLFMGGGAAQDKCK